jgi:hypothetical protein
MLLLALFACKKGGDDTGTPSQWECQLTESVPFAQELGCLDDFELLASAPLDASIPGARSVKTVVDRVDDNATYFQNSQDYLIHWEFATAHLSGDGLPIVPDLSTFNATEYYSPDRRFILGSVTYYEQPDVWAWELSPYDTADAELIETAFRNIAGAAWFGDDLYFHPTSASITDQAALLPDDIPVITTNELFEGITYQPLNLGTSMGFVTFYTEEDLETAIPYFREIVVLDAVPNDISVVMGIITDDFQTPLSHINVLSQNRGTPNMALRGAFESDLRDYEGKWVELTVEPNDWSIREVTADEADAWWEEHKPDPLVVRPMETDVDGLWDEWDMVDMGADDLGEAIRSVVPIFGGKASHYSVMAQIGEDVPHPVGFAIPVHYYDAHMEANDLWVVAEAMLADETFQTDPAVRREKLAELQDLIIAAPIDPELVAMVEAKILDGVESGLYPSSRFRFRSSTNAEDVSGFNGAGLYDSKTGDPSDSSRPVEDAMREVWASLWSIRAYEEREYYGIDHRQIGMALMCHRGFPDEEANGVAITNNIYDSSGLEPAFYINVQVGEESVVFPEAGTTTDQIIYYYDLPNQPAVYIQESNLTDDDGHVLTDAQLYELGTALKAVHLAFQPAYGDESFYAMDTEFKLDQNPETGELQIYLKQARPYPGWNAQGQ